MDVTPYPISSGEDQGNTQARVQGARVQKVAKTFDLRIVGGMRFNVLLRTHLGGICDA